MINFHDYVNENKTEHNKNWPCAPDHPYRILLIGGSGSGKKKCFTKFNRKPTRLIKYICMQKIHMKQNVNI